MSLEDWLIKQFGNTVKNSCGTKVFGNAIQKIYGVYEKVL